MPMINRTREVRSFDWPVTSNLHFLGFADNLNNILIPAGDHMTLYYDESGNRHHGGTGGGLGEVYEPNGSSQGLPCIRTAGTRLLYNGGTPLTTSSFSIFWVGENTGNFQLVCGNQVGGEIGVVWSSNLDSPLIRNNVNGTVVQGSTPLTYATDYSDQTSRSFAFIYDDASNVRTFYVNGVKTNEHGDTGWLGTPAGAFTIKYIMNLNQVVNNRQTCMAVYEGKLLNDSEVLLCHQYIKNTLGLVA